jgi:glycosyltransferase involved in cell wall biosynthesis
LNVAMTHDAAGVALPAKTQIDAMSHVVGAMDNAMGDRKIRLLVFTSLYPNAAQPRHGIFVEERLRHLVGTGRIEATVVAPVPWFPFGHRRFGRYATFAQVPHREQRHGIQILHPRYVVIPKVGVRVAPRLMFRAAMPILRNLQANGSGFDLIDAHYFYPDGVAAVRLGEALGKPVIVTARGSDVTWIPRHRGARRRIRWAAGNASAIVTVSQALKIRLCDLGVAPSSISVLRNGVDLERFGPRDREAIRAKLDLCGTVWLAVGNLIELKGVNLTLAAMAQQPETTLLVAGEGPEEPRLRQLAERLGITSRVRFLGSIPHLELCAYYNAADALVLASSREGMPNVVLESLACGTPVVAAPFDGVTELLDVPEAGEIASDRSAEGIAEAWLRLRERAPSRAATRSVAERLGWQPVVEAQCALYERVLSAIPGGARQGAGA